MFDWFAADSQLETDTEEAELESSKEFCNISKYNLLNIELMGLLKEKLKAEVEIAVDNIKFKSNPVEQIRTDIKYLQELIETERRLYNEEANSVKRKNTNTRKLHIIENKIDKQAIKQSQTQKSSLKKIKVQAPSPNKKSQEKKKEVKVTIKKSIKVIKNPKSLKLVKKAIKEKKRVEKRIRKIPVNFRRNRLLFNVTNMAVA